jgi:predicted esterase
MPMISHPARKLKLLLVSTIGLLAVIATLPPGCAPAVSSPAARPTAPVLPAPAAAVPVVSSFDIPQLSDIKIDGDPTDWADRGFKVLVMRSGSPRRLPVAQFDAQIRLGWSDRGLLLLADVTDPEIHESDLDAQLGVGTDVEVVMDTHGGDHWETDLSPGVDPHHPQLRMRFADDRLKRTVKLSAVAAAKKTPDGYLVEAEIPWDALAIEPKDGAEFGLQVRVNQPHGQNNAQLLFLPKQIRLAENPSGPVTLAVVGGYERFKHTRFSVAATSDLAGRIAVFKAGDDVLGQATMKAEGRLAFAEVSVSMPPFGKPYKPVVAWVDGKPVASVALGNADDSRRGAVGNLDLVASPAVFNTPTLPSVDFYSPGAAEDLLGAYEIHTTYYNANYDVVTSADKPGRYGAIVEVRPEFGKPFKRFLTLYHGDKNFNLWPMQLKASLALPPKIGIDPAVGREQESAAGDLLGDEMRNSRWRDSDLAIYLAGLSETPPGTPDLPRRLSIEGKDSVWWYGLKKKTGDLVPYKYLVHVPSTQPSSPGLTKYPLILFLHGSGERGNVLNALLHHGPPKILKNEPDWAFKNQFIIVSPQCPEHQVWDPLLLRDLLDDVDAKYPVDPDRVYLTGLSMGGAGTWDLAEWFPERFAALVPIAGGGDPADAARIADIPIWVIHGGLDPTVRIENAYQMVQALRDLHARVRFTVYPDYGHNSWEPAYDDPRLYEWMLQQHRGQPMQPRSTMPDTRPAEK